MTNLISLRAAVAATVLAGVCATTVSAAETLIVSNGLSPTHIVSTEGFDPLMACIKKASGGEIDFNYFPSGQLAPVSGGIDALNSGLAQIAFVSASNEASKLPLNNIPMLPGLGENVVQMVQAYRKSIDNGPMGQEFAAHKIHPLVASVLPPYQIMSAKGPIKDLQSFSGVLVRAAGGSQTFGITALGGTPVEMPAADLYTAMQRGTVDATVFAMSSVKTYNVQELLKSLSSNGSFGSSAQVLAISDAAWKGLSEEQRTIMTDCGHQVEASLAKRLDEVEAELKTEFAGMGIEVYEFTPEAWAPIAKRLHDVSTKFVAQMEERGLPAQQAFDEYKANLGE